VLRTPIPENVRAVQEIVHQHIDRDHNRAGFDPHWRLRIAPGRKGGQ